MRVRGAAVLYVFIEDLLIAGILFGAFAFADFGQFRALRSPLRVANLAVMLVAIKFAFFWTGLYDFRHLVSRRVFWNRIFWGFAFVYVGACVALAIGDQRVACLVFLAAFAPIVLLARFTYEFFTRIQRHRRRLLFMGIGDHAQRTAREILDERSRDYEIVGFLAEKQEEEGWRIGGRSVLGVYADLEHVVECERVDQVVVAVADRRKLLPLEALLRVRLHGVEVLEEAKIHEEITGKIPVEDLRPSWLIFSEGFSNSALRNVTKRMFDVVVSTVMHRMDDSLFRLASDGKIAGEEAYRKAVDKSRFVRFVDQL